MGVAGLSRGVIELLAFVAHGLHHAHDGSQNSEGCAGFFAKAVGPGGGIYGLAQAIA